MSLNENTKNLIRCVCDNDTQELRRITKNILENESGSCNKYFCDSMLNKLNTLNSFKELPYKVDGILQIEDVRNFNEKRYYLSDNDEMLYYSIISANEVNEKLREMSIKYLNSALLYGESGTGKTTFGKYLAYKLNVPFLYLNFSHCINSLLGETGKNITKAFEYVQGQKCVFMVDEIDAISTNRNNTESGTSSEIYRVTINLMQCLDTLENNVILLGATNRIDMVDKAIIRRFNIQHEMKFLSPFECYKLIRSYLTTIPLDYNEESIHKYTDSHSNFNPSNVTKVIIKSIIEAVKTGNEVVIKENLL